MTAYFESSGNTSLIDRFTRIVTGEHKVLEFFFGREELFPNTSCALD
jgi:hypothetical protein